MKLYIEGYRTQNKALMDAVISAAHFYTYKLLGGRMYPHIVLDIKLRTSRVKMMLMGIAILLVMLKSPENF